MSAARNQPWNHRPCATSNTMLLQAGNHPDNGVVRNLTRAAAARKVTA
jgi:hypothetical protein